MELNGISAIVTGGASGIGEGCARLLAGRGAKVVIADLQDDKGNALATEIGGAFAHVDVTNTDDVIAAIELAKEMGPLRALVNSRRRRLGHPHDRQGRQLRLGPRPRRVPQGHRDQPDRHVQLHPPGRHGDVARPSRSTSGERGAIVNMASVAAFDGQIGQASYSASKGGVVGMTLPVARDLSAVGIRVNTIAPGLIDTPIYGEGEGSEAFKAQPREGRAVPASASARAEELASMVVELLGNSYMNAETIRVDGGIRMPPK